MLVTPRGGEPEPFDEVVLATHSDQALALLADASDAERRVLGAIPYQANEAVLHTDTSILPRRRRAWASWNYHLSDAPTGRTTVTYHMNRLQSLRAEREFCVTLNRTDRDRPGARDPHDRLRPSRLHAPRAWPPRAASRRSARSNRTHFCGAYWGWGFHEDGVVSALRVAERFGARL